jgi:soluble lytic murein transglycosylase-like protein
VSGARARVARGSGWRLFAAAALCWALPPAEARADLWSYEHNGTVMFTNIPPSGDNAHKWQVVWKVGPGKAQAVSGSGPAGCRTSRADVVPARDQSPERFHRYDRYILEASTVYGLPEAFIRSIIKVESDYDPQVVSCAGARGLLQIMPEVQEEQRITDVFDPRRNILGGARLLRQLANRFRGDLVLTIAGFHAGAGAVLKYDGVPPYETTQQYVRMVLREYGNLRGAAGAATAMPGGQAARPGSGP